MTELYEAQKGLFPERETLTVEFKSDPKGGLKNDVVVDTAVGFANAEGGRSVPVREFYLGPGRVALKQGEVLTHVIIPKNEYEGYHGHYIKYSMRNAMDIATISCSVVSKVDQQAGVIEDVRITFGVAAPVPYRCTKAEEALKGMKIEESLYEKTAQLIREEINPRDSWRASRAFRLQIGGEIAARALRRTVELAGGDRI